MPLNEFEIIARHFAPLAGEGGLGLLDDAALLRPPPGHDLVLTKDAIVAGVHFLPDDPPADIARKLLRVNLSDLAAKGAQPIGYLIATGWPDGVDEGFIAAFAAGLAADQEAFKIMLLGGDTVRMPGPLTLSLTAIGSVSEGTMIRRAGAKAGDLVFVTGTIGDAGLGLIAAGGGLAWLAAEDRRFLITRYRVPEPRLAFGVAARGLASAAIDVSDGLLADAQHLARASAVALSIEVDRVPLSPAAARGAPDSDSRLKLLGAGDDYEILLTAPPEHSEALRAAALAAQTLLTQIGHVEAGSGVKLFDALGKEVAPARPGYRHF